MPTGYTCNIADGSETTLRQFALRCARGMGALITMRDEPFSAPIPEQLEPDTRYYDETIADAQKRLDELHALSADDRASAAASYNTEAGRSAAQRRSENNARAERYDQLIAQTEKWSDAPEGLQSFMLDQLKRSRDFDIHDCPDPEPKSADDWFSGYVAHLEQQIGYAEKSRADEIKRTAERNVWLAQLHEALKNLD